MKTKRVLRKRISKKPYGYLLGIAQCFLKTAPPKPKK